MPTATRPTSPQPNVSVTTRKPIRQGRGQLSSSEGSFLRGMYSVSRISPWQSTAPAHHGGYVHRPSLSPTWARSPSSTVRHRRRAPKPLAALRLRAPDRGLAGRHDTAGADRREGPLAGVAGLLAPDDPRGLL